MADFIFWLHDALEPWRSVASAIHTYGNAVFLPACLVLVWWFLPAARLALRILIVERRLPSPKLLMCLGVFLSFLSKSGDGGFWWITWALEPAYPDMHSALVDLGVWVNIPMRLGLGSLALTLHAVSVKMPSSDGDYHEGASV